ncbi:(Fe-S)-binding protein [Mariniphaga sediminis]|uniref:(Fe-S)-binding protein n=1 Tax=Mariniphaga sediminis TaxID=1628158 RepID=A0A399D3D3_9BACT|nr:(Fe-S)-binding protein [Mariniphaga sediminis]RIH65221.1 (Fe-S)-binding protein [Mariniphaga sediminis]
MENFIIIPFTVGLIYLTLVLIYRFVKWVRGLSKLDKLRLVQSFKIRRMLRSLKEVFYEGLLHRKIFRKNPVLGYMHMSLAFGWFLLIVLGHIEVMAARRSLLVPFYLPVFFRYFETGTTFFASGIFSFLMDFFLLIVLSGVALAMLKRFKKQLFGMKKTTRLKTGDRMALTSLWLIFPLRLLAEGMSAELYGNGSFLTSSVGHIIGSFSSESTNLVLWTAYSCALGFFFAALPNSRYMHIPTEVLLIFVRNAGIRLKKRNNTYTDIQVFSCSRCGLCLDNCQMAAAGINHAQSVYILKNIRNNNLTDEQLFNCLLCGKCEVDCPVGINTIDLRITQRIESTLQYNSSYNYLEDLPARKASTIYFAGCMTHLTPGIIASMKTLFHMAGENVWFMDEEKAPCCGRPLMLAGQHDAASKLIVNNTRKILGSGAKTLVVSCPICYKVFREDYELGNVEVLFHAEYISRLIREQIILPGKTTTRIVYHDPCELGRGMGMFEPPREVLRATGKVIPVKNEKQMAHCCGGSLGNLKISQQERAVLRNQAVKDYQQYLPDVLATACPLCKKTFARHRGIEVMDIAEIVVSSIRKSAEVVPVKASVKEEAFAEELV